MFLLWRNSLVWSRDVLALFLLLDDLVNRESFQNLDAVLLLTAWTLPQRVVLHETEADSSYVNYFGALHLCPNGPTSSNLPRSLLFRLLPNIHKGIFLDYLICERKET